MKYPHHFIIVSPPTLEMRLFLTRSDLEGRVAALPMRVRLNAHRPLDHSSPGLKNFLFVFTKKKLQEGWPTADL